MRSEYDGEGLMRKLICGNVREFLSHCSCHVNTLDYGRMGLGSASDSEGL